ncbi:MAG: aspartate 1-decarboxylase [Proteobacteria bacterium]|nr:aspartate 1-decarboxylase [Pseudomonadota bacterium]MBU1593948.1 aspartate 1-decarboxylase [Pseudomonadota bacterium]
MPRRTFLSAKIHGATLTSVNLDYEGSISVDVALLEAVGILPFERIDVYNLANGERLTTYAIPGAPGEICLNGAAAHKGKVGQKVILATYLELEPEEIPGHRPSVIRVDAANRPEAAH